MRLIIDGQLTEPESLEGGLEGLVQALIQEYGKKERVVSSIRIDGEVLENFEGPVLRSIDPLGIETLEIRTESMAMVSKNILRASAESVPALIDELSLINRDLQSRNPASGLERTENALTYWISIVEGSLKAIQVLKLDLKSVSVPVALGASQTELNGFELLEKINSLLEEIQSAFENEDNLEIGDLFEYDLPPLLRSFQDVLFKLAEKS